MKLSERLRYIGVDDHSSKLFENQWPLDKGVTYNSYLVLGDDKVALIDTAEVDFKEQFLANIKEEIADRKIDYLVVNHMEPDHSALMLSIIELNPNIEIIASKQALPMIKGYHNINQNLREVKDGELIELGGASLLFKMTPMVHWPETMMTYYVEEESLFAGDVFGCFGAVDGDKHDKFEESRGEMIRYYSNIMGKYGSSIQAALRKISAYKISRICSTHGPIWEKEADKVIALYQKLSQYQADRGVCLVYASMYGNTEKAAFALAERLKQQGIEYDIINLNKSHLSYAYAAAFKYDTIIIGSPTYNNDAYPAVREFLYGLKSRMLKNRRFFGFGSFTWMGGSIKIMNQLAEDAKFEILGDGIAFGQAYSEEKCNFDELMQKLTA